MRVRTREIAKVGIFGSKDDPQIVTEKDLQEIAETFPEVKKAPGQFGHWPDASSPRLSNVIAVSYNPETQILIGTIEEEDILADAVDAGYYPDISIGAKQRATDGKMYLRHLAYLGQEAPAVKDLIANIKEPLGIAASDNKDVRTFPSPSEKQLYLSDVPTHESLLERNITKGVEKGPGDSPGTSSVPTKPKQEETTVTDEEAKVLRDENDRLKKENQQKEIALSESAKQQKNADKERLKTAMDGKIPKGLQGKVLQLSDTFENGKTIELSDADTPEGKRTASAMDVLIEVISALPIPVETGVLNLSDHDNAGQTVAAQINYSAI